MKLIIALLSSVTAWWDHGHLLTARIAYDVLQKDSPGTIDAVNNLLEPLREADPKLTKTESAEHGFVECATWADIIKNLGGMWQYNWHFVDQPYLSDGDKIEDYPKFKVHAQNVSVVVPQLANWLKGEPEKDNFVY